MLASTNTNQKKGSRRNRGAPTQRIIPNGYYLLPVASTVRSFHFHLPFHVSLFHRTVRWEQWPFLISLSVWSNLINVSANSLFSLSPNFVLACVLLWVDNVAEIFLRWKWCNSMCDLSNVVFIFSFLRYDACIRSLFTDNVRSLFCSI